MLLHAGISINSLNIMTNAVEWGELSVIKALISAGASLDGTSLDDFAGDYTTPLQLAVKKMDQGLVELLLEAGADINNKRASETALCAAAANGDTEMARYLLDQGADPHDSAALQAAASSNTELFDLLLNKHVERYPLGRKRYGSAVLKRAIQEGDESTARMLLVKGADPNDLVSDRETDREATSAFGFAIMKQQRTVNFVEMCLQAKCEPNGIVAEACIFQKDAPKISRVTALLAAISTCSTPIVELLIQRGAQINFLATGPVMRTPLQRAAEIGSISMVQLLLRHGADINAPPARSGGGTALQLAAIGGYIPIVCTLMSHKADVNAPASIIDGRTALEGASENGRLDTVQILLNGGAGCKENGQRQLKRAIKLAKDNGHFSVSDLLKNFAANEAADSGEFIDWEPREEGGSSSRALSR